LVTPIGVAPVFCVQIGVPLATSKAVTLPSWRSVTNTVPLPDRSGPGWLAPAAATTVSVMLIRVTIRVRFIGSSLWLATLGGSLSHAANAAATGG
jgi:hypothetical protein